MQRHLLRSQIKKAWEIAINQRYQAQLINSERGLQLYFCEALLRMFEEAKVNRRLFIEPCLQLSDETGCRYPDVVVCNTKQIIGIIEFKYAPRIRANTIAKKDIATLEFAAREASRLTLSNDRYLGPKARKKSYPLADDAVLCWAGVYKGDVIDLRGAINKQVLPHFLQLNALTIAGEAPHVVFL
jgi:hypothetical protein